MFNAMSLAVGFFGGTLFGICVMALAAAGELRPKHQQDGRHHNGALVPVRVPRPAVRRGVPVDR